MDRRQLLRRGLALLAAPFAAKLARAAEPEVERIEIDAPEPVDNGVERMLDVDFSKQPKTAWYMDLTESYPVDSNGVRGYWLTDGTYTVDRASDGSPVEFTVPQGYKALPTGGMVTQTTGGSQPTFGNITIKYDADTERGKVAYGRAVAQELRRNRELMERFR